MCVGRTNGGAFICPCPFCYFLGQSQKVNKEKTPAERTFYKSEKMAAHFFEIKATSSVSDFSRQSQKVNKEKLQ
jgi:hypothetical protein